MNVSGAVSEWQRLLGGDQVLVGDAVVRNYGSDTGGTTRDVPAALRISDAAVLPEVMRIAHRHGVPVYPISTGHNWGYGTAMPAADGCVIIDLAPMNRIVEFDAELGVVTVEPGVTQGMLAAFLEAGDHPFLVPVTGAGPSCSLLGNALERGYGVTPHVDHFAAVTDLQAVLADGSTYRSALSELGGEALARLFRWGIGPYSAGLFTQSGFGIVTRVSIALARRPQCVRVALFSLRDDALLEPAVERVRDLLRRLPGTIGAMNLMNRRRVLAMAAPYPRDQLGPDGLIPAAVLDAMGRQYQVAPWTGFCTLYGSRRIVAAAEKELRAALRGVASRLMFFSPHGASRLAAFARWLPGDAGARLARTAATLAQSLQLVDGRPNETAMPLAYWRHARPPAAPGRDPARDGCGLIWYSPLVPMRPGTVRGFVEMVEAVAPRHRIEPLITLTTLNERVFDSTVPLLFDRKDAASQRDALACFDALFDAGREMGCVPYRLGSGQHSRALSHQRESLAFTQRLRDAIDPLGLIAPGRYHR